MGNGLWSHQLEDRYFMQKVKLGQGSFGTVWRAVDRQNGDLVAIKKMDKGSLPRRGVRRQDIEREISMMQACDHENITRLYDFFEDYKHIYLALEYCDSGDFADKVKERGSSLQEAEAADWMRQILAAIAALHVKDICHRDIKPDNFMVSGHGGGAGACTLKLSDFGLALFMSRGQLLTERCGTPAFMSPEQFRLPHKSKGYGMPVDIWAAGISMYMMIFSGHHPFMDSRGTLNEKSLVEGAMDFNEGVAGFLGSLGGAKAPRSRCSEKAHKLCRQLACPDPRQRITAQEALRIPWLQMGREPRQSMCILWPI
eukprot:gnl/TRDRNA2_/TRDRNA2_173533_c0_seq4.p1 gnl/TRDRNA2_/TRDRNA2_173533_c0~~gnl/TRDRNA2_/TRDRNA2_173533_c0_seq4.p1  ORF type:complete len:313 (+),score=59.41 gnl/TRDRNA2_/TRDRNA2_173533_c0_seq4:54-992(+)